MEEKGRSSLAEPSQMRVDINGISTNLLCQEFSDKYFIVVTQWRKLGTMTLVTEDSALPGSENIQTHTAQVLLGVDDRAVLFSQSL
ncbi:proteasome assembly chaperone 3-like isoform X2 [Watersipora subatra]|uniref:proteasome assembly chaperone 3-like isoform X2 n=1 Tax=Watersipora subatra TaxID=2589382 RepID=UPI00355B7ACA